jgi:hypothetical protein
MPSARSLSYAVASALILAACSSIPEAAYRLPPNSLEDRAVQTREFEVDDEAEIVQASVAVLQDMEYNLDVIERPLGVLTASKTVDADSDLEKAGLIVAEVGMFALATLGAAFGGGTGGYEPGSAYATAEDEIILQLTMVVLPSLSDEGVYIVRMTIQETLLNKAGQIKERGTITKPLVYQEVFDKLSTALFLEGEGL